MFAEAPRPPVHPVAGRRALGGTETQPVLGGQRQGTASLRLQNLGRRGAYSYFTLQQVFWGEVYSVPGTAPLVQTLTSSEALHGRANKCASPEQLMGCLGARSPAAEARCWAGG